jgi:hypothetical protein
VPGESVCRVKKPRSRSRAAAARQGRVGEGDGDGDGDGLGVPDTVDPTWLGVADTDGVADRDGVAELLGLGLRGVGVGLCAVGVRVGVLELVAAWPDPEDAVGVGLTWKYSASTARNSAVSTMVEVRGQLMAGCRTVRRAPLMMPRWRGRCRGRRRR